MKKLWWALCIGLVIAALCVTEIIFTTRTISGVETTVTAALYSYKNGDIKQAGSQIQKAAADWREIQQGINVFLYHDTVDDISTTLIDAENSIIYTPEEFVTQCEKAKEQLRSLKEAQLPKTENIL